MNILFVQHYLHHDALGSVRKITNSNGDSVCSYRYYPYGKALTQWESKTNDLKFTEKPLVDGMNCYDFSARYYDPEIARFYALDPMPSGGSPYAYCGNNPVLFVDPSGMAKERITQYDDDYTPGVGYSGGGAGSGRESPYYTYEAGLGYASRSGGHLSNNGVWVSGLTDASGQRFNTWSTTFYNYALRSRFVSKAQDIIVEVNRLSSDYFNNIGRFIQEFGVMINPDYNTIPRPQGLEAAYVDNPGKKNSNQTLIHLNKQLWENPKYNINIEGLLASALGHEGTHLIQNNYCGIIEVNKFNGWSLEQPAVVFANDIRRVYGLPEIDIEQLRWIYYYYYQNGR